MQLYSALPNKCCYSDILVNCIFAFYLHNFLYFILKLNGQIDVLILIVLLKMVEKAKSEEKIC